MSTNNITNTDNTANTTNTTNTTIVKQGTSTSFVIGFILIVLKLAEVVSWSWMIILLPFYWKFFASLIVFFIMISVGLAVQLFNWIKSKLKDSKGNK